MTRAAKYLFGIAFGISLLFNYKSLVGFEKTRSALYRMGVDWNIINRSLKPMLDKPFIYRAFLDSLQDVFPVDSNGSSLLPNRFVIEPGTYLFHGQAYDLKREGLYRFAYPGIENQQRLVYKSNVDALISGLVWTASHGGSDNEKTNAELTEKARQSKLFITCGRVAEWGNEVLLQYGLQSRIVSTFTLDDWNSYNNGHVFVEVYRGTYGKWVLYDLDNNSFFRKNGTPLSTVEMVEAAKTGDFEIAPLSRDARLDVSDYKDIVSGYDYSFFGEKMLNSLKSWYQRVVQVQLIKKGEFYYFYDSANRAIIESTSRKVRFMERETFMNTFYTP